MSRLSLCSVHSPGEVAVRDIAFTSYVLVQVLIWPESHLPPHPQGKKLGSQVLLEEQLTTIKSRVAQIQDCLFCDSDSRFKVIHQFINQVLSHSSPKKQFYHGLWIYRWTWALLSLTVR